MPADNAATARGHGWPASSFVSAPELMQTLQDDLPVRLISTRRSDLQTCEADEPLADVVRRNEGAFDFFPVVNGPVGAAERIVGLVALALYTKDSF